MASVRVAASVALLCVLVGAASARRMPLQYYGGSGSNAQASAQSGSGNYGYYGGSGSNAQASAQSGSGGGYGGSGSNAQAGAQSGSGGGGYGGSGSNAQAGAQSGSGGGYGGSGSNAQAQANSQSDDGGVIFSPGYGFIPQQQNNANANAQVVNIICAGGAPCGPGAVQQQPCYAGRPCPYGGGGGYYQGGPVAPILNGPIANAIRANVAAALGVAGRRHH